MKNFLLLSAAIVMMAATVNAQIAKNEVESNLKALHEEKKSTKEEIRKDRKELRKLEGKEVSFQSRQAFYKDFGNVPQATWTRGTYYDEVAFTDQGKGTTAYYDFDGELVGTTTHKDFSDIPAEAQKYINKKYRAYNKEDVIFFHDNEANETDMLLYGSQFDDADNYFVALKKGNTEVIVRVNSTGDVSFFKEI